MAKAFLDKPVATIKALVTGTTDSVNVKGTNPDTTPDNAKTQIDKVLALVGNKTVSTTGMIQTITKEAVEVG